MSTIVARTLWRPDSGCGTGCLTAQSRVSPARRLIRAVSCAGVLARAVARPHRTRQTAVTLLRSFGVEFDVQGAALCPGALVVAEHISWLDIIVMQALSDDLRPVAKQEVGDWPVIGRMARLRGTVFVDRSRPKQLPAAIAEVVSVLEAGVAVQVFPEGTTSCGGGGHGAPWRGAFFQAAIDAGAPVQRLHLSYSSPVASFVGDESLLRSLRRVIAARGLTVTVRIDEPRSVRGDRRALAAWAKAGTWDDVGRGGPVPTPGGR